MTIKKMDHRAIFDIACIVKPTYDVHQQCYIELLQDPDSPEKLEAWYNSIEAYHKVLMKYSLALGKATTIGSAGIKMLMGVRGTIIIWTPEWLRNVANYERINPNYWIHPQARKLNNYEFPQEICS